MNACNACPLSHSSSTGEPDVLDAKGQSGGYSSEGDLCAAAAFTSVSGCVAKAFQINGLRGPFQGVGATIVRNTPANSIYLGSFEVLKQQFAKMKGCECAPVRTPTTACRVYQRIFCA